MPYSQSDSSFDAASKLPIGPEAEPEAARPSPRGTAARRALFGAAVLGILADPLLRNQPWGLGLSVWMLAFAALVITLMHKNGQTLSGESHLWLVVAVLFAASLSWRGAALLQLFDMLAMLTALVLLAMSMSATPVSSLGVARVRNLIRAAFETGINAITGIVPLVMHDAEFHTALHPSQNGTIKRVGKALAITVPLLLIFTLLLTHADPVFGSFFKFPDVRPDVVISHIFIAGFFAWLVAGWLRRALFSHPDVDGQSLTPFPLALGATDVTLGLGALTVLFAAFIAVQVEWLFGGEALILRTTDLSYAEYARRGFFELMAVAGLMLPVILGAHALIAHSDARTLRLFRRLSIPLVVLLGAIMLSAGARMKLYVHYYGLSTDRIYVTVVMIWLAIVFVLLALTVLRARPRKFALGLVSSGFAVLLALNVLNPDALVARANLARGDAGRTAAAGRDLPYVASLGGDAVPRLVSDLLAPTIAMNSTAAHERCVAAGILLQKWTGASSRLDGHWTQWNLARRRATEAVRAHETKLRQLACR